METKFEIVLSRLIKSESQKEVLSVRNKALEEIVKTLQQEVISLRVFNKPK